MNTNTNTNTNTTPAVNATPAPEKPATVYTVEQFDAMKQRNANSAKQARKATVDALLKLYRNDPVSALASCAFKANRNETPVLTEYTYTVEKRTATPDRETRKETAKGYIAFNLLFFADSANRKAVNKLFDGIARTATAKPEQATNSDGKKHLSDAKEIVRLCGFGVMSDSVNPSTVSRMMNDARFSTGKGNRQFDTARAKLSLFGFLWATANKYETLSAYTRDSDAKEQARKAKEQARKDARQAKKATAKKQPAKKPATAKKATATPAK